MSSTQTSRNGTWPRSLAWTTVRFNSLSSTPSPQNMFSFFLPLSLCSNFYYFDVIHQTSNVSPSFYSRSLSPVETSAVFQYAHVFNSDLSKWNVAKVSVMSQSTFQFPLFSSLSTTCCLFFLLLSPCASAQILILFTLS